MANFSIQSSAWILAIITIDRYLIVSNRFNWKQKFSKNINFTLSVIVTVIGFFALINLPAALLNGKTAVLYNNASLSKYGLISRNRTECYNTDFYRLWQNITVLIECIFPLALMIIFNGLLINRTYKSSVKLDARHITRSSTILAETTTTVTPCQTSNSCTNLNHISSTAGKLRKNSVYNNFYFDPVTHLSKTKSKNLFQQYCSLSVIPPANAEEDDEVKEDFAKQYSKSQRRHSEAFESTSNCNGINNQMDTFIGNNRFLTPNNHKSSTNNLSMTSQMNLSKSFTSLAESKPVTVSHSRNRKIVLMLTLLTLSFTLSTLPSSLFYAFFRPHLNNKPYRRLLTMSFNLLRHLSHAFNFVIYFTSSSIIKQQLNDIIKELSKKKSIRYIKSKIFCFQIKSSGGKKNECADKPDRSWSKSRAGTPLNEEHAETSMLSKKTLKIPNGSNNKNMAISELENLDIKITKLNKTSSDQSSLREPSLVEFESITFSVPVISNKKI